MISCQNDIVLLSPSIASLQLLLDKISELIDNHYLKINVNKTVAMTFSRRSGRRSREIKLFLNDNVLQVVHDFNYLGCVLTSRLYDGLDIDHCNLSFKRSFGFLFRKFYSVHVDVLYPLFNSLCSSFMPQNFGLIGINVLVVLIILQ